MPPYNPNDPTQQQIPTQVRPNAKAPTQPVTGTPYDFIMSSNQKPPKSAFSLGNNGLLKLALAGVALVIIIFAILLISQGGSTTPQTIAVAQQQAEISRVAGLYTDDIQDQDTKNFVLNTQLSLSSAEAEYLTYLGSRDIKVDGKDIALGKNAKTDSTLEAASGSGTLDSTLRSTLQTMLESYQTTLRGAYQTSQSQTTRTLLQEYYDQADLLLEQSKV